MKLPTKHLLIVAAMGLSLWHFSGRAEATESRSPELQWHVNYREAMDRAEAEGKLLLVYFFDAAAKETSYQLALERQVFADPEIRQALSSYVLVVLPRDHRVYVDGKQMTLMRHESFKEMLNYPGVAIVDMAHKDQPYFHHVVSAFPLSPGRRYGVAQLKVILTLPPGTLTQRTLTYAVRTHPERPGSADGKAHVTLTSFAERHSQYMADIQVQGHHDWESRFHQLEARLPDGLEPTEVAAESWPGQPLVEAAEECVYSWRRSSGHWESVRGRHPVFGFDMKRGRNGIWYATGIFGRRR